MVSLSAETLFHIGNFPVTNTVIDTLLVDAIIIAMIVAVNRNIKLIPGMFQNMIEWIIEMIYGLTESVASDRAKKIFPYFMTFVFVILISNWSELIPVIGAIGFHEEETFIPIVRSPSTDLNFTLALALVSLTATHAMSIKTLGFKEYITRFISLNPFNLFIGLLELISEFTKIISFSFRLFGNIFVGSVLLASISAVGAFLLPLPLIGYELAVGVIQAVIFGMLTMAFMSILTTPHNAEH